MRFVTEEGLGGPAAGRGPVSPACVVVHRPERLAVGVDALLVGSGVALHIGRVDYDRAGLARDLALQDVGGGAAQLDPLVRAAGPMRRVNCSGEPFENVT